MFNFPSLFLKHHDIIFIALCLIKAKISIKTILVLYPFSVHFCAICFRRVRSTFYDAKYSDDLSEYVLIFWWWSDPKQKYQETFIEMTFVNHQYLINKQVSYVMFLVSTLLLDRNIKEHLLKCASVTDKHKYFLTEFLGWCVIIYIIYIQTNAFIFVVIDKPCTNLIISIWISSMKGYYHLYSVMLE